jgi:diaminohydroxyphosphoribosylaminopyrimidine deaminase / 5-amino-6-(5-phosphoribosylamino)uracil reductase
MSAHDLLMRRALKLAENSFYISDPNPRVGCVIARDGAIIAEGWTQRAGEAHAEIHALQKIDFTCVDADIYVSLEPCSHIGRTGPCVDAIISARPSRVFIAMRDPNPVVNGVGIQKLRSAGIEVVENVCAVESACLNPGFIRRMNGGRPYVRAKIAATLDGKTATQNGKSQWITGHDARADVHKWRARSSVMVTGIGTLLADNPRLNARLDADALQPDKVIVDSKLRTPQTARIFDDDSRVVVATTTQENRNGSLSAEVINCGDGPRVNLDRLVDWFTKQNYNEVFVEAGNILTGAFLEKGLIDELIIYLAPQVMGDVGRGMFGIEGITSLDQVRKFEFSDIRRIGADVRLICVPIDTGIEK